MRKFTVVLTPDEDDPAVLNVSVPSLPGCHTWGKGKRQALRRAKEAIALYIESLNEHNEPIPAEAETAQIEISV
jgi:predicted RNase H-like HicB family nuclease